MEDESEGSGNDQSAPLSAEFHFVPPDSASREHCLICVYATHWTLNTELIGYLNIESRMIYVWELYFVICSYLEFNPIRFIVLRNRQWTRSTLWWWNASSFIRTPRWTTRTLKAKVKAILHSSAPMMIMSPLAVPFVCCYSSCLGI